MKNKPDNIFLLGVTGGIASGKSTVARMLEDLGAPMIDFDIIARQVVEPGKQALKDIAAYFGEHILQADGHLDRKKLSRIVFSDEEKRKKLEGFLHPPILLEFKRLVNKIAEKHTYEIIQAVIPLLFEVKLQYLVHKTLVVYIPQERQIERLIARDGISKEEATSIIRAQLSIEEKTKHCDFIINNDCPMEETKMQVEDLWKKLKKLQSENR